MILEAVPVTFRPCHQPDGPPRTAHHATTPKPWAVGDAVLEITPVLEGLSHSFAKSWAVAAVIGAGLMGHRAERHQNDQ
ncbi:hypothetical protein ACFRQM_48745, partial [Streptomyces sp. NPDC056831]|uniref:hypothetical protein n=1 Tax=Streptomyces sp. NPDC056831 TaxID=3345954 RepID=UPI00367A9B30